MKLGTAYLIGDIESTISRANERSQVNDRRVGTDCTIGDTENLTSEIVETTRDWAIRDT